MEGVSHGQQKAKRETYFWPTCLLTLLQPCKTDLFLFFKMGFPGTLYVDPASLKLTRDPPASASQVLRLKACTTTARLQS